MQRSRHQRGHNTPTLREEFDRFLRACFPVDPPSQHHADEPQRQMWVILRVAFYTGCLHGVDQEQDWLPELVEFQAWAHAVLTAKMGEPA